MLETVTVDTFAGREGETFTIRADGASLAITLARVTTTGAPLVGGRVPFSVLFRGPPEVVLPQRIYRMEHDAIGALDVFLVTIGPDKGGMGYEAVFA